MNRPAWHNHAACRGGDMVHIFFPGMATQSRLERARQICAPCPVRQQCAETGRNEPFGIWAGDYDYDRQRGRRQWKR